MDLYPSTLPATSAYEFYRAAFSLHIARSAREQRSTVRAMKRTAREGERSGLLCYSDPHVNAIPLLTLSSVIDIGVTPLVGKKNSKMKEKGKGSLRIPIMIVK